MTVPTDVFVMRDSVVSVEEVAYENQTSRSRLVPNTPVQTERTLVPDGIVQDVDNPDWVWEVRALQKNKAGGLAKALRDATVGSQLEVVFTPVDGLSQPTVTFTILAMPVVFGGEAGKFADFEASFPVVGQPVFSTTPAS